MTAIFISHSSQDANVAAEIRAWLSSQGHRSVFLDFDPQFGIPAGRSWEQELYRQLQSCRAMIVVCSHASMASRWCFAEIAQARSLGKALLPIRIDDCKVDPLLATQQVIEMGADRADVFQRLHRGLSTAGLDAVGLFDWDPGRPPYPGLLSFQEKDAGVYFGRDEEIGLGLDLMNRVRRLNAQRLVVVLGASGCGKSSLVRAGLVPRLRRDAERWLGVGVWRPRDDPVGELAAVWSHAFTAVGEPRDRGVIAAALREALGIPKSPTSVPSVTQAWPPPAAGHVETASRNLPPIGWSEPVEKENPLVTMAVELRRAADRPEAKAFVVVDQLEELLNPTSPDAAAILGLLRHAAESSGCPLVAIATLRSDFLEAFQTCPALIGLGCEFLPVGPMSAENVTEVIEGPARIAGLELRPGLVQALLADTDIEDALPLLAFTLRELYDHFGASGRLDAAQYHDFGALHGALGRSADELIDLQRLDVGQENELRGAFLAMVRLADDDRWVRHVARWDDLPRPIHPILEQFVAARLLVSGGDAEARTIEVAHEALFRSWKRLAGWLEDNIDDLRLRRNIIIAAEAWAATGRESTDLWRGQRLAAADELAHSGSVPLGTVDLEFIRAAIEVEQAEVAERERTRRRKLRVAATVATVALILAATSTVFFIQARRESDRAKLQTRRSAALVLAAQAEKVGPENPALGLALAVQAVQTTSEPTPQATAALFAARNEFAHRGGQQIGEPLVGHTGTVSDAAFAPDGRLVASASFDGTLRLWDSTTGENVGEPFEGHSDRVYGLAFSPDGSLLASASWDATVRLWDPSTGATVGSPLIHSAGVNDVAFSADGHVLASASDDGTVRLWDPVTGAPIGSPLVGHADVVIGVAFSPDGRLLASSSWDATVRLWDPGTGQPIGEPINAESGVFGVAFNPDGSLLASSGDGGAIQLWDPATGEQVRATLRANVADEVNSVAFSPDGRILASAGSDATVQLWDPTTGDPIGSPLRGHTGNAYSVSFSPDGRRLVSAGADRTLRLWDRVAVNDRQSLEGHDGPASATIFDPEGRVLASAGFDGTVRLWDPSTGQQVGAPLLGHDATVWGLSFSPDGQRLASASEDGTVRLWDPSTGQQVGAPLPGHDATVWGVAFSPDGLQLASAGVDGTVRLWNPASGAPAGRMEGHSGGVFGVAFSPDGRRLASAGSDTTVRLWDLATSGPIGEPMLGHAGTVWSVAFSPDGRLLASASADQTVRLWDPATGEPIGEPLLGHTGAVVQVAFSVDGTRLASASDDGTVRLWDPATGLPVGGPLGLATESAFDVAFSPDGQLLASAGETVKLWDRPWDVDAACEYAADYIIEQQVEPYLPSGQDFAACVLEDHL